jgi:uncharacterized protein (DUF3820 family)
MSTELTDQSIMPLGLHKGKRMEDVPADYLVWYRENAKKPNKAVMEYIIDNWQVLLKEKKECK